MKKIVNNGNGPQTIVFAINSLLNLDQTASNTKWDSRVLLNRITPFEMAWKKLNKEGRTIWFLVFENYVWRDKDIIKFLASLIQNSVITERKPIIMLSVNLLQNLVSSAGFKIEITQKILNDVVDYLVSESFFENRDSAKGKASIFEITDPKFSEYILGFIDQITWNFYLEIAKDIFYYGKVRKSTVLPSVDGWA